MILKDFLPRVRTGAGLVRDFLYLVGVVTPMMLVFLYGLYAYNREWIVGTVKAELGIDGLATEGAVTRLAETVEGLAEDVRRATGEDRVIRQPQGLSYVEEPVSIGENVVLWLTVARTRLGKDCRLTDWTPLFTDSRNVPLAGTRPHPGSVRRQIGDDFEKLRVEMVPPPGLEPGRIELYLVLDYDCGGKRVPDRTDVVTYQLVG
ncbi:hypothetical protein [Salipiger sp. PrR003]|uniref:hypothetical protein n=1 Tax=Salipiger sp. PrR003 TaxID=2706776 RepID=UPI0013DC224E|nr:hypothetical protein [Salipiger sp. PrR003]NDV53397.1 hypothetical protein [Salipiger sp. PrR003]